MESASLSPLDVFSNIKMMKHSMKSKNPISSMMARQKIYIIGYRRLEKKLAQQFAQRTTTILPTEKGS